MILYHLTPLSKLKIVLSEGLLPRLGPRSRKLKETRPAIYFFPTLDDVEDGLNSWVTDEFSENARIALLAVTIPPSVEVHSDVAWERHVYVPIPPSAIRVLSRDVFGEVDVQHLSEDHTADQGFNIDAYHGTHADFDSFDPSFTQDIGMHFGTAQQADRILRPVFSPYKDGANIIPVKLRLRNPLRVRDMFGTLRTRYIARAKTWTLDTPGFHPNDAERKTIYDAAKAADKARQKAGGDWGPLNKSKDQYQEALQKAVRAFWQAIQTSAERQGYDGLVYQNRVEGKGDSYVVFDPKNVRARHASFDPQKSASHKLLDDAQPLQEGLSAVSLSGQRVRILQNPSPEVLLARLKRTRALRGILLGNEQFWANGGALIHVQISSAIGSAEPYGDARLELKLQEGTPKLTILPAKDETYQQVISMPSVARLIAYFKG